MNTIKKMKWLWVIVGVLAVIAVTFLINNRGTEPVAEVSPSSSESPQITSSPVPVKVSPKPKPSGSIIALQYPDLLKEFDERYIRLGSDCQSSYPSNVEYKNGTTIMLDNKYSTQARTIKIGDKSYGVGAGSWIFITLSSPTLPVNLPMYCGSLELGQIGLVK